MVVLASWVKALAFKMCGQHKYRSQRNRYTGKLHGTVASVDKEISTSHET
jgi:hypothetical protein